ncbi:putative N-acetylmannosaminyltransferase [Fictibacillus macauensis ZFHKF-1]|uniref:N-acetylglucosaminyldiphosphoundecaprenol N-acetyl-beta-D-mannosaminyltransferase n=1 Tax=Fictibacillus macauensis ZFHKF-1 TaxID=1196324 RepID=I8UJ93_9BACL|nr:WecB/TagA/CpsF family glycosyltransferase [Fictibacillus macauensis]EIT86908.1 putative N-acetylmannosaminyltransferase [Fictibacillus macauensis ZFHKF-1]
MNTVNILGIDFYNTTFNQFIDTLSTHLEEKSKAFVVTANPEVVMRARKDQAYKAIIQQADYVTADGIGIVKGAGLLGTALPERVTGYDMTLRLLQLAHEKQYSVYLLGGKDHVVKKAAATIAEDYPNVRIAGYHHGFFDLNDEGIVETIQHVNPDIILVALGLGRQEAWISQNKDAFQHGIFIGVGGTFDGLAGEVQRAPEFWQKLNLEWFYRLMKEPSRWRRQLVLPHFALKVLQVKMSRAGKAPARS